jgi:hypothetical protein
MVWEEYSEYLERWTFRNQVTNDDDGTIFVTHPKTRTWYGLLKV